MGYWVIRELGFGLLGNWVLGGWLKRVIGLLGIGGGLFILLHVAVDDFLEGADGAFSVFGGLGDGE